MDYTVLLFYKFVEIKDPLELADQQRQLCKRLGLKGRILIAEEGINGTVSGSLEAIEDYKQATWAISYFKDLVFKESLSEIDPFPKLKVKVRPEIITLQENLSLEKRGEYLAPDQLQQWYENGEEFYIFDTRNGFESEVGAFVGAIKPPIEYFRDLPKVIDHYAELKDKKVVTYCTGGIRCEKVTALLKRRGFQEVYQLEGGIVNYLMQYPHQNYEGDCYVFDDRMQLSQDEIAETGRLSVPVTG